MCRANFPARSNADANSRWQHVEAARSAQLPGTCSLFGSAGNKFTVVVVILRNAGPWMTYSPDTSFYCPGIAPSRGRNPATRGSWSLHTRQRHQTDQDRGEEPPNPVGAVPARPTSPQTRGPWSVHTRQRHQTDQDPRVKIATPLSAVRRPAKVTTTSVDLLPADALYPISSRKLRKSRQRSASAKSLAVALGVVLGGFGGGL
jgi:hypothetical protein